MTSYKETIVIAMGGSLLVPESIDTGFIKQLKKMVDQAIQDGYQIALVVGGGKTCRYYQASAREFENVTDEDLDWIGIKTIHLNCELLFRVFSDLPLHPKVVVNPDELSGISKPLVIVGAWEPGCSSDTDAVHMASAIGAQQIINFSNTSYVYSADPRKDTQAIPFKSLSWGDYRKLIPAEWTPGLSAPFDPVASRQAQEKGIRVAVLGASLENLYNYLSGKDFEGTIIF